MVKKSPLFWFVMGVACASAVVLCVGALCMQMSGIVERISLSTCQVLLLLCQIPLVWLAFKERRRRIEERAALVREAARS